MSSRELLLNTIVPNGVANVLAESGSRLVIRDSSTNRIRNFTVAVKGKDSPPFIRWSTTPGGTPSKGVGIQTTRITYSMVLKESGCTNYGPIASKLSSMIWDRVQRRATALIELWQQEIMSQVMFGGPPLKSKHVTSVEPSLSSIRRLVRLLELLIWLKSLICHTKG